MACCLVNYTNRPSKKKFVLHLFAQFWISRDLGGVKHCQDDKSRSHHTGLTKDPQKLWVMPKRGQHGHRGMKAINNGKSGQQGHQTVRTISKSLIMVTLL